MGSSRGKNHIAVYTIRVERTHLERLRAIAHAEHRELSQKLRSMIEREIEREDSREAA